MTLADGGRVVLVRDAGQAMEVVNWLAPEHLELVTDGSGRAAARRSATPARSSSGRTPRLRSVTTPPARTTCCRPVGPRRFASALRVDDFRKHVHVVRATPEGSRRAEPRRPRSSPAPKGLDAHAHSLDLRANL